MWSVPAGGMASVAAWLPFVRAAAVGWVPLAHHPVPPTPISRDRGDAVVRADVRVRINVSGHRSVLQRPSFFFTLHIRGWFGSRVVSVLDSGAEGPGFESQPRRCRVTVLGKLFTPIVPLFTKQRHSSVRQSV